MGVRCRQASDPLTLSVQYFQKRESIVKSLSVFDTISCQVPLNFLKICSICHKNLRKIEWYPEPNCQQERKIIMSQSKLIPERLVSARTRLNINRAEAARRVGLTNIGYNRYESGDRRPSPQMIRVLAETLGTSTDYLIGKIDNPEPARIIFDREEGPEVFDLLEAYRVGNAVMKERISAYAKAFEK